MQGVSWKLDELFLEWMSQAKTRVFVDSIISSAAGQGADAVKECVPFYGILPIKGWGSGWWCFRAAPGAVGGFTPFSPMIPRPRARRARIWPTFTAGPRNHHHHLSPDAAIRMNPATAPVLTPTPQLERRNRRDGRVARAALAVRLRAAVAARQAGRGARAGFRRGAGYALSRWLALFAAGACLSRFPVSFGLFSRSNAETDGQEADKPLVRDELAAEHGAP